MNRATRHVSGIKYNRNAKISIVILTAGEGNRMKSHGPRSLIRLTPEQNLITYQVDMLNKHFPNNEIILVCGHDAEKVMNNSPNSIIKIHNEKYEENNVVRSIGLGLRACTTERVLIIYGDLLFNNATFDNIILEDSTLLLEKEGLFSESSVGCTYDENQYAEQLLYDLPNKWVQIAFFTKKELSLLKTTVWNREKDKLFGFEAINEIINKNGRIKTLIPKNMKIIDIDSSKDLAYISQII